MSSLISFLNRIFDICNPRGGSIRKLLYFNPIAFLFLAFFSIALQTNPATAAFSIEYQASADPITADPTTQGFIPEYWRGSLATESIADDLGYPAWSISTLTQDTVFAYISGALTADQKADISNQGFTLTLRARVLQGIAPAYDAGYNTVIGGAVLELESTHYDLALGINSSGNTVAVLLTNHGYCGPGGSLCGYGPYTLNDSGYHTYDLVFNPLTQSAILFIDGVERISGYTGSGAVSLNRGLLFGVNSGGGMNFNLVRLTSPAIAPNANRPPTLNPIGNKAGNEGALLEFTLAATDPDGDALTYSASNLPAGATFNPATQAFSWTPEYGQAGNYSVLFAVTDNGTPPASDSEEITITVGNVNRPPTLNPIGNKTGNEGALLEFTLTATDPDGDTLTYSASNLPAGATFNPATQAFSWTPEYGQAGSYTGIHFETTDGNLVDSEDIAITVNAFPPSTVITFSAFNVNPLRINQRLKTFFLLSSFTLGLGSNGIDPTKEPVIFTIAGFTATIPAGSFRKGSGPFGVYAFAGKIDGVPIEMLITPLGNRRFGFQAAAYGANLNGPTKRVKVGLTIGNDSGETSVNAIIIK